MIYTEKQHEAIQAIRGKNNILLYGGSRSSKTFLIVSTLITRALYVKSRHLIVRKYASNLTSITHDTLPKVAELMKISYKEQKQQGFVQFANGSEIWFGGLDDEKRVEKILGNEYSSIFANEVSEMKYEVIEVLFTRLAENVGLTRRAFFDENPPRKSHWSYKYFIKKVNPETNIPLSNADQVVSFRMNPHDNPHLPEDYIRNNLENLSERKRQRFLLGEFTDEEGALWTDEIINPYRKEKPELKRIVIAVDPAVTSKKESDETGIIITGEDFNKHYYVLEDMTGKYTPNEWGNLVDRKWAEWKADLVVCEVNNGGDLVESNIKNINPNIRVKKIHSSRGKLVRAEPIAGLYEQGRVHHVGYYRELENELTSYDGSGSSPNRMDALVFGISELSNETIGIFNVKRV